MKRIYKGLLLTACVAACGVGIKAFADNVYIYNKQSEVVYTGDVDKVALDDAKKNVIVYDKDNKELFKAAVSDIDNITVAPAKPVADLLDVQFNADGTATDLSPMKNTIQLVRNVTVTYNPKYHRNMAVFDNTWAGAAGGGYYKFDYQNNQEFKDRISDGHTLEAIVCADYQGEIVNDEAKFFAAHEAGGTGLMVCKQANGMTGKNEYTFLPNTGGYRWAVSGVFPEPKVYHHIVGVWNKEEAKAYVYVDGELKNTVDAAGNFKIPGKTTAQWFGIGTDAGGDGQFSWKGNVVTAKIYDKPLTGEEVSLLWNDINDSQKKPVADLLDVQFNEDGTATDLSPMKLTVEAQANGSQSVYYNNTYKRYVARFNNTWGGALSGKYKIDFENNQAIRDALADGHTLEAVVMADYDNVASNKEAKFFSAQQAGGTGLMVCRLANSLNNTQEYAFLTNNDGWKFVPSGVYPTQKAFHHIVGVWNKEEGKSYVYVDGVLKNTLNDVAADFKFASAGSNWFCIGGDSDANNGGNGWVGEVVLARAYDKPLTQTEVDNLWSEISELQEDAQVELVTDVNFYSGVAVKIGGKFSVYGNGFQAGDKMELASSATDGKSYTVDITPDEKGMSLVIPTGFESGKYRMKLHRGEQWQDFGSIKLTVVEQFPKPAEVIAHRGYWNVKGKTISENSRAALQEAQRINAYGSETDVWITTDGYLMINHNATIGGVEIQNSTYLNVKDKTLSNGETIPQLKDLLDIVKNSDSKTKLIIEIKTHSSAARNMAAAEATVKAVQEAGLQDKVEYIAFDFDVCKKIAELDKNASVAYLSGGKTPAEVNAAGVNGLDYSMAEFRNNPTWIQQAKDLGMSVNVWTVNSVEDMAEMTNAGVQYITTDSPEKAQEIQKYYLENQ